ncbi:MAG: hypothetical protein QOJ07_353 [Thermoleophilaceae bacterium]|nr:hypothetical protein [Thermoleophilaceae bacterium]
MLAYVFWHRPDGSLEPAEYERRLGAFHARLAATSPAGFVRSAAFRVTGAGWLGDGYEDWYLVDDWASLGLLNQAAVDAVRRPDHDAVAGVAGAGSGGVYAPRAGTLPLGAERAAAWSDKPRGVAYADCEDRLTAGRRAGEFALWQRQLVLGPAPELCLRSAAGPGAALAPVWAP